MSDDQESVTRGRDLGVICHRMTVKRASRAVATVDALGPMLGAGVLLALAPAAALTGTWLPFAVVLAVVVALLGSAAPAGTRTRELLPIGVAARVFAAGAVARCAGEYVLSSRPWATSLAVLVFAAGLASGVSGAALRTPRRFVTVVVLAVLAVTVLACFAIGAPENPAVPEGVAGADDATMIPAAAALLVFAFGGGARTRGTRTRAMLATTVVLLLVMFALLRQLGAGRLAASPVPLVDGLVAADAAALVPLLLAAVVLAALGVSYGALRGLSGVVVGRGRFRGAYTWCGAGAAFGAAVVLPAVTSLAVAAGCLLLGWLCAQLRVLAAGAGSGCRYSGALTVAAAAGAVLDVVLFVMLPLAALAIALGVSVLAVSAAAWRRSTMSAAAGSLDARERLQDHE